MMKKYRDGFIKEYWSNVQPIYNNKEDGFKVSKDKDKNIFKFSLSEIHKSNIQLVEIDWLYNRTQKKSQTLNVTFLNKKENIIKFMEQTYKIDISANAKHTFQLMILFPKDIEEGCYCVECLLYIKNINQYYEGFTIFIDIGKDSNNKKVQMNSEMMLNIFETIKCYNDKKNIKHTIDKQENISIQSLKGKTKMKTEMIMVENDSLFLQCQRLFNKVKIEKKELQIKGNNDLSQRKKNLPIQCNSFEIIPLFKENTINSNNHYKNKEKVSQNIEDNQNEKNNEQLIQENKMLKNEYFKLKRYINNKKKGILPSQEYSFSINKINIHQENEKTTNLIQSQFKLKNYLHEDLFESTIKDMTVDINKIKQIEKKKEKPKQFTKEEIEKIIVNLDTNFLLNIIINRSAIIDCINK